MSVVGRLTAYLFADTADFESGMKRASKSMLSFQDVAKATIYSNATETAIRDLADGFKYLTLTQGQSIVATDRQAESLGIASREYSAMSRVASEAGVDQEGLAKAITKTQQALLEAANGSTQFQNIFKALGLNWRDVIQLSPDKQFEKMAQALAGMENPTERTTLATKLYGKEGRAVIDMLVDYQAKLDDARAFNDKFNLSLSEVDAKKVDEAGNTMGRVKDIVKGLGNAIDVQLSPLVTQVGNDFIDSSADAADFGKAVADGIGVAADAIDVVREGVLGMRELFGEVTVGIDKMVMGADQDIANTLKMAEKLPVIGKHFTGMAEDMQDMAWSDQSFLNKDMAALDALNKEAETFVSTRSKIDKIQKDADARAKANVQKRPSSIPPPNLEGISALEEAEKRQKELLKSIVGPLLDYQQTLSDLNILYRDGKITADQYNDALDKLNLQVAELDKTESGGFLAGLMKINMEMKDVGNTAEQSLVGIWEETTGAAQKLQVRIDALDVLMGKGLITARNYSDQMLAAKISMAELDKTVSGGITAGLLKVQQEMNDTGASVEDSIVGSFNDIVGPGRKAQATMTGLNALLAKGIITTKQYGDAMLQAQISMSELDKTASGGFHTGILKVQQEMNDVSDLASQTVVDAFQKGEDALVEFATTGKLSVKDLVNSMIADFARLEIRSEIEKPLFSALSGFLGLSTGPEIINWNQGGSSIVGGLSLPSFDVGTDYVPYDMVAQIHKGEKIIPAGENNGGGMQVTINNNAPVQVSTQAQRGPDGSAQLLVTIDKLMEANAKNPLSRFSAAMRQQVSAPVPRY